MSRSRAVSCAETPRALCSRSAPPPLGAATVSDDLVFTTLYTGVLIALDRTTGAIVYQRKLPTSANAPIAIAGNSVLLPAGGPSVFGPKGGSSQLVVYTVR